MFAIMRKLEQNVLTELKQWGEHGKPQQNQTLTARATPTADVAERTRIYART